jgi:hypothetical protein
MAITSGLTNSIKQVGADAMMPSGSTLKIALIKVGATGTYDKTYASAYVVGLGGDEVATANGYTQGGIALAGRTAGPTDPYGWVDYGDAVWTAVGALAAIGAVVYDSTNANRIVGFIDFGGTKTATDAAFTVTLPGDAGPGTIRVG